MDKVYKHQEHEERIYRAWEKSGAMTPPPPKEARKKGMEPFCISMPPPNANGALHIGHAMFVALEDIMIRFNRMRGRAALWLPGADHAGILTQVVYERELVKKGKTRYNLGREEFYRQCYRFSQRNKQTIYNQFKRLGASCDWTRERFTLNPRISQIVLETFVKLYEDGLVYRGDRLINWCPRCMTALSDLEVEYEEEEGKLWFIRYPLAEEEGKFMVVATTRPETMLGDTAVAVHPQDKRYKKLWGRKLRLPLVGRLIPVVADESVDPEFGTGAVKVTPAHDPDDWQIGQRHGLKAVRVIDFEGKIVKEFEEFAGLTVGEARKRVVKRLEEEGLIEKVVPYSHRVGHCERCKTTVEPLISKQWFVATRKKVKIKSLQLKKALGVEKASLAEMALLAVKRGETKILPKRFEKIYFQWLKNIRDWCVSRQLWWGHRLPIWYCGTKGLSELQKKMNPQLVKEAGEGCGQVVVAVEKPEKCPHCGNKSLIQDPDTLDTWFSSAQWPFTTLGFPEGEDYEYFYPTSVMETGYDILFFWVARMMMVGLYRTQQVPFKVVYLHGLVRDERGQKMSKSKGNVINPLEMIEKFGADALRMALIAGSTPGNDVSVGEAKIKGYRNFGNKLWNIGRFVKAAAERVGKVPDYSPTLKLKTEDKKIVDELETVIGQTTESLKNYRFSEAVLRLHNFVWHRLADWYVEAIKERIRKGDAVAVAVLRYVFLECLKLLHPFAPFVTEAVWERLKNEKEGMLIKAKWPTKKR